MHDLRNSGLWPNRKRNTPQPWLNASLNVCISYTIHLESWIIIQFLRSYGLRLVFNILSMRGEFILGTMEYLIWPPATSQKALKCLSAQGRCQVPPGSLAGFIHEAPMSACPCRDWAKYKCLHFCSDISILSCTCTKKHDLNFLVLTFFSCGVLNEKPWLWGWEITISDSFQYSMEWINCKSPQQYHNAISLCPYHG